MVLIDRLIVTGPGRPDPDSVAGAIRDELARVIVDDAAVDRLVSENAIRPSRAASTVIGSGNPAIGAGVAASLAPTASIETLIGRSE